MDERGATKAVGVHTTSASGDSGGFLTAAAVRTCEAQTEEKCCGLSVSARLSRQCSGSIFLCSCVHVKWNAAAVAWCSDRITRSGDVPPDERACLIVSRISVAIFKRQCAVPASVGTENR